MRTLRRSSGILGVAVVAATATGLRAGPAQAHPVGPKQYFTGVINGKDGLVHPDPVVPPSQSATVPVQFVAKH